MTKINKIVMHGFKSFGRRTELVFGDKFNIVLGANGSGKSNILDAICFVLGKSSTKSLRAERASNLIYNGGKAKKPAKYGEVSIYFDNTKKTFPTDEKEIKITRIVRSAGQSVYRINEQTRTRQEVLELLSMAKIDPDGHNIILQGDIVKFIEMSTNDRRQVIEEISGISMYEEKKQKALRELERVDDRIEKSEIVLKERGAHLRELKKDRDQAVKYRELNNKIKSSKASYLKVQIDNKTKEKNLIGKQKEKNEADLKNLNSQISKLKDDIEKGKSRITEINYVVNEQGEVDVTNLNKEIEELRIDITKKRTTIESYENEIQRILSRREQLKKNLEENINEKINNFENEIKELSERETNYEKHIKEIEKNIATFREKHKLGAETDDIDKEIELVDKKIEEENEKTNKLNEEYQGFLREKDGCEIKLQTADDKIKKVTQVSEENKEQLEDLKNKKTELKKISKEIEDLLDSDSDLAEKLGSLRSKLIKVNEEFAKLKAKSLGQNEQIASNIAIKRIIDNKNKFGGIHGIVSELGNSDSKYSLALEIAAGAKIKSIVVDNDKIAADCIKYLKQNKLGTATLIPLNKIKSRQRSQDIEKLKKSPGVHGFAVELVGFDPKYKNVFEYVFSDTLIVDNVETARKIGVGKARMITLEGDLMEKSGVMHGGFRKKERHGSGFKEKNFEEQLKSTEAQFENLTKEIQKSERTRISNENLLSQKRTKKAELEGSIIKLEHSLHLEDEDLDVTIKYKKELNDKISELQKKIDYSSEEIREQNTKIVELKKEKEELRAKILKLKNPVLIAQLQSFEAKKTELKNNLLNSKSLIETKKAQISVIEPEKENTKKILKQLDKDEVNFKDQISKLKSEIKLHDANLKVKEKESEKLHSKFKSLFEESKKINEENNKKEIKIGLLSEKTRALEIKINTENIELAKLTSELVGLEEEFKIYNGVPLLNKSEEELKKDINAFERMKESLGGVNLKALEIYEDVEKEFKNLEEKKEKLSQEKIQVHEMINEIEGKKKDLFLKTYDIIKDNFHEKFSLLAKKGEAHLELENLENPFEGGIDIKVKIIGKKFLDIRSLSGGEKTLTALAFIFAVQEYEPASFYILDEVDAALDKHNSEKLALLIKKYTEKAQYILISHNDAITSEAEFLYGVSMDENNVSKVVSLKI